MWIQTGIYPTGSSDSGEVGLEFQPGVPGSRLLPCRRLGCSASIVCEPHDESLPMYLYILLVLFSGGKWFYSSGTIFTVLPAMYKHVLISIPVLIITHFVDYSHSSRYKVTFYCGLTCISLVTNDMDY